MHRGRGGKRGPCPQQLGVATENFRIRIDSVISDFINDHKCEEYPFPPDMSNVMRRYVHERCLKLGIKSRSYGKEPNRVLVLFKKKRAAAVETFDVGLTGRTADLFLRLDFNTQPANDSCKRFKMHEGSNGAFGSMFVGPMPMVERPVPNPLLEFRKTLPIQDQQQVIMEAIRNNSVVIVSAETGSGKTTQIPQYLLEEACEAKRPARVVCTQPRRLSTISVAERVAAERGERLGQAVGYQIKLESKMGQKTSLIYCTNGILLRSFMVGYECMENISHIIVDEIHERDKFTDFLLICLRQSVKKFPHLRVILMSATMDMDIFTAYFDNPTIVNVQGRCYEIKSLFLDEVLLLTNYENQKMKQLRRLRERNGSKVRRDAMISTPKNLQSTVVDPDVAEELDALLPHCLHQGAEEHFVHLLQLILNENVSPNYQEPNLELTPLMVAAARGNVEVLEQLLNLGADPFIACKEGLTASGWAQRSNNEDVVRILSMYQHVPDPVDLPPSAGTLDSNTEISQILADYDRTVNEEFVDYDLIVTVIEYIHRDLDRSGAILVFLPGYDDIMTCHERIRSSQMDANKYSVFMLHGSMQTDNQSKVFAKMQNGKQKIILSTNIAETSITIDDVRYVVDSGKVKMKCYDTFTGISTLAPQWISMASAMQRAGRAGRTQSGYCFHLYSLNRYNSFNISTTPEILRVPLHELCLHTKSLAPQDMSIQQFLNLAIEPPSTAAVETSISVLKNLGAIDADENLTPLGNHLVQLSIEPHLGKMLIYSVIFKCLDPILTIVACLAHKDPFVLPVNVHARTNAMEKRRQLSEECPSDHFTMLRAYQMWQEAKVHNQMYRFSDEYFVSVATMEVIVMTRSQLLSQLRAKGFVSTAQNSMRELNEHAYNWAMVKACLSAGLYPNAAYYNERKLHTRTEKYVLVNQSSALKQCEYLLNTSQGLANKAWYMYEELSKLHGKCSIRCATAVTPLTIGLVCGLNAEEQDGNIVLDDWFELKFHNDKVPKFRALLDRVVQRKIDMPRCKVEGPDLEAINTLASVLSEEDLAYDFKQPEGVGKRPLLLVPRSYTFGRNSERPTPSSSGSSPFGEERRPPYQQPQLLPWRSFVDASAGVCSQYNAHPALFPPDALYFVIKSQENRGRPHMWRYSPATRKRLLDISPQEHAVILIYARHQTHSFCGVSRFLGENLIFHNHQDSLWVDFITQNELPFAAAKNFIRPNINAMHDGQQLQSEAGQRLCAAIYEADNHSNHHHHQQQQPYKRNQFGGGHNRYQHQHQHQMRPILGKHYSNY